MPSKDSKETNQRVAWLKAVQGTEKCIKALMSRMDELEELKAEGLQKFENEREAAQQAHEAALHDLESSRKRKTLEMDLEFERTQRDGAIKILRLTNEEPIKTETKNEMETLIAKLQADASEAIKEAEEKVRKSMSMHHRMELERNQLCHEKDQAMLTEHAKSLEAQLAQKDQIIRDLRVDAIKTQELVAKVAEAGNRTTYVSSNQGK